MNPIISSIINTTLGLIIGLVFSSLVGLVKKGHERESKETQDIDILQQSMCALMRQSMLKSCEDYLGRGWCSIEAKKTLNDLLDKYHKLGGNSFITGMVNQVNQLPNEKPTKKRKEVR